MVNSSACLSELTRPYAAGRIVSSMTLGPPGDVSFAAGLSGLPAWPSRSLQGFADYGPDLLVGHSPQLVFKSTAFELPLQGALRRLALVLHDSSPKAPGGRTRLARRRTSFASPPK